MHARKQPKSPKMHPLAPILMALTSLFAKQLYKLAPIPLRKYIKAKILTEYDFSSYEREMHKPIRLKKICKKSLCKKQEEISLQT